MSEEEAAKNKICGERRIPSNKFHKKIEFLHKLMAHKKLLVCTGFLAICYFGGVTWAETAAPSNGTIISVGSALPNATNIVSAKTENSTISAPKIDLPMEKTVTPPKCSCDGALLPRLAESDNPELCPECKCQHEARNTTLIKVVVIIVIWIISILVIYMLFLMCLDPLLNKRVDSNYQEHIEDDDTAATVSPPMASMNQQDLYSRANVLNRVSHQQDKWKRQVREQRRHIYDRRTMLN